MTHGSLFSGIGGFDLAAEWMGWENIFHCEWNPFGQKVLKYYWPKAISYENICATDFSIHNGQIDILTGGFPCQPYSSAGKRLGKEDERHLWPEMLRAIREIEPTYIVGENVRGLLNWNGGMVFDEVCAQLEDIGYQVAPCLIPACGVDAPHRRERIWFVAHAVSGSKGPSRESRGVESNWGKNNTQSQERGNEAKQYFGCSELSRNATNSKSIRQKYALENRELEGGRFMQSYKRNDWNSFPSVSPICTGNDGIPTELDGITFSKWRQQSIKAAGNAIVPQVAFQIFKTIEHLNRTGERLPGII